MKGPSDTNIVAFPSAPQPEKSDLVNVQLETTIGDLSRILNDRKKLKEPGGLDAVGYLSANDYYETAIPACLNSMEHMRKVLMSFAAKNGVDI